MAAQTKYSGIITHLFYRDSVSSYSESVRFTPGASTLYAFGSSGEFHTFRLPVPSLWLDILQKAKAAGLNAISVYIHWGLLNPAPGVIDFGSFRALQPLFDAAMAAGVWVVLRPGPYINAETTAGGIAHWVTSKVEGKLRTNATDFHAAWQDYVQGVITQTVPNQISEGGPVIGKYHS